MVLRRAMNVRIGRAVEGLAQRVEAVTTESPPFAPNLRSCHLSISMCQLLRVGALHPWAAG